MKLIPLGKNQKSAIIAHAIVDDEFFEILSKYKWIINKDGYAIRYKSIGNGEHRARFLHADVFELAYGKNLKNFVDHEDRDKLNNLKSNLRAATYRESILNKGPSKRSTTGLVGVTYHKDCNKYEAKITFDKKIYSIGYFISARDAAIARDIFAKKIYPNNFAYINFPNVMEDEIIRISLLISEIDKKRRSSKKKINFLPEINKI